MAAFPLPSDGDDPALPLHGVVVADFSRVLAAPMATMTLADLGATVIKVEHPSRGDDTRSWGPPWTPHGSSYFAAVNRSKRSIRLDLTDATDLALAHELVRRADVLIENFLDTKLTRFGLAPEQTRTLNPRLVHCSVTGFGSRGGAAIPGYDFVVQALGGLMSITGDPTGDPMKVGVAIVDVLTGKDATIGILAALRARDRSGDFQRVEVNLLSSLLSGLVNQSSSYLATGTAPGRMGNQHPSIAPYETLRCRDGQLALACGNDGQFRALAAVLGDPALGTDPRFATNRDRVTHREDLVRALEARLSADDAASWQARLTSAGVPAGRVHGIDQAFALAEELGLDVRHPMPCGHADQVAHPVTYSGFAPRSPTPPPSLGQHDHELRDWLSTTTARPEEES
ncbi:CoA transferase [Nocardioides sp. GY 10113]|uniref:CaiB/BaiF CoA transferase family protein n=1 Tax=Nocardioides sp. GY 10113 TaxID=2569761 RepID=UPI0010A9331D|nr:CoA transferase [Nocardioides sp. GY 10113]TIC83235.1 CoA transferase [Nocardioides sp. GY 10113]